MTTAKPKSKQPLDVGQRTLSKFVDMPDYVEAKTPKAQPKLSFKKKDAEVKDEDGDVDMDNAAEADKKTGVKKKRIIESDDEDEDEDACEKPEPFPPSTKKPKLSPSTSSTKPSKSAPSTSTEPSASTSTASPSKPIHPLFLPKAPPKPKSAPKQDKGKAKDVSPPATAKGKAKAKDADEEDGDERKEEEEEEEADEEEEEDEEDGKAASKLAELATHQGADKVGRDEGWKGWKEGEPVPYSALTHVFASIESTTKRLIILERLTAFLVLVAKRRPEELIQVVYLCINRLCPDYVGLELGIGESLLIKAVSESTGRSIAKVKEDFKAVGDLGTIAQNSRNNQPTMFKPKPLTVPGVFKSLTEIAKISGNKSQDKKVGIIKKLLAACLAEDNEAKYLIRSLEGKLRIRLAEKTVVVAVAHAVVLVRQGKEKWSKDEIAQKLEEGAGIVKQVYSELPNYDAVVPALLEVGVEGLKEKCKLTPGVPLKPMLAKPTKAIGEVLDRFEGKEFTCEYKYDGERAQIHYTEDGRIAVFSRNSENMSVKYPDLVEQLPRCIKPGVKSFVLDSEAVAYDKETHKLLPFQELSRRKRKDVKAENITVKVHIFAFDLLYLNGEPLLQHDLGQRRKLLRENFGPVENEFAFAKTSDTNTVDEIQTFLEQSVRDGCEGLMVKMLEGDAAWYEPSRRSMNWLKLKKDYLSGVGDSLDLVVVGGYYGKGKRTNVYGAFLLACYDPDTEEYQTICKIGTGFSDEVLESHYAQLKELEISRPKDYYKVGGAKPDVFFEPKVVWEVLTADLSLSPVYTAAMGHVAGDRGVSLRFPRFIRIREDKDPDDATTSQQIGEMYERQATAQKSSGGKKGGADEDDGFW